MFEDPTIWDSKPGTKLAREIVELSQLPSKDVRKELSRLTDDQLMGVWRELTANGNELLGWAERPGNTNGHGMLAAITERFDALNKTAHTEERGL